MFLACFQIQPNLSCMIEVLIEYEASYQILTLDMEIRRSSRGDNRDTIHLTYSVQNICLIVKELYLYKFYKYTY